MRSAKSRYKHSNGLKCQLLSSDDFGPESIEQFVQTMVYYISLMSTAISVE